MPVDTKKYLDAEGLSHFWDKIKTYVGEAVESKTSDIHFVVPNEKEATKTLTATVSGINTLSPGLAIALRMPFDSVASQTLNINNLGAKPIYYQSSNTDAGKFPSGAVVFLIYETTSIATGCFKAVYSYDGAQPSIYQGATSSSAGIPGLVPSAASSERNKFLRGDGTWKEVSSAKEVGYVSEEPTEANSILLDDESFIFYEMNDSPVNSSVDISILGNAATASSVNHNFTLKINNGSTENSEKYTFNGSEEKTVNLAEGNGISLAASNGTVTISTSEYQGATASSDGTAGLVPSAASNERENFLRGDGTWEKVCTAKEVGYVSSEPSNQSTEVLDNESFIFYETGQADSGTPLNASITGNAATASSLNHALTLKFNNETDEGNSQYTFNGSSAKEIDFAAGIGISLTASLGIVTIAGNAYQGATDASNGVAGLVPPATFSERNKYLKGDGTWAELTLPSVYQGATASANGIAGLVPAAASSEKDKYLKGDGTWAELTLPSVYQGATDASNGVAGLVPPATFSEKDKYLKGDGTWAELDLVTTAQIDAMFVE